MDRQRSDKSIVNVLIKLIVVSKTNGDIEDEHECTVTYGPPPQVSVAQHQSRRTSISIASSSLSGSVGCLLKNVSSDYREGEMSYFAISAQARRATVSLFQ